MGCGVSKSTDVKQGKPSAQGKPTTSEGAVRESSERPSSSSSSEKPKTPNGEVGELSNEPPSSSSKVEQPEKQEETAPSQEHDSSETEEKDSKDEPSEKPSSSLEKPKTPDGAIGEPLERSENSKKTDDNADELSTKSSSSEKPAGGIAGSFERSPSSAKRYTPDVGAAQSSERPPSQKVEQPGTQEETVPSQEHDSSETEEKDSEDEPSEEPSSSLEKPKTPDSAISEPLERSSEDVGAAHSSERPPSSQNVEQPGTQEETVPSQEHDSSEIEEKDSEDEPLEEPSVLEYTPPKNLPPYHVEDHFWEHKRKLIPDYNRMEKLDDRAKTAPKTLKDQPQKLVDHLTENLTSDLEKSRVLIRWISENIAYVENPIGNNTTAENVLKTQQTNCQGYSNLMEHFCRLAGVECKTISGFSKGAGCSPGKVFKTDGSEIGHAWNKVKIEGRWYLCDPTWAAGGSNEHGQFEKQWNEDWFLTHPEAFLSTHLPFNSQQGIFDSEQLVETPIYSVGEWSDRLKTSPLTHAYNIRPINYLHPVIEVQSAELTVSYSNPLNHVMKQWTELKQHQPGKRLENQAMLYTVNEEVHVNIRLPEKGSYSFEIFGKILTPDWPNENGNNSGETVDENKSPVVCLFWYKIDYKPMESFIPGTGAEWGMTPHYQAAGFKLLAPTSPILQAKSGTCQIQMQLPTRGVFPTFHQLYHPDATTDKLKSCVYGEKRGNKAIYHIHCPYPGEYRFEINYKPAPHDDNGGYYTGAAFLIECQTPVQDPYCYTDWGRLGGPHNEFYTEFGLSTSHSSSTVTVQNGQAELPIRKTDTSTRQLTLFAHLYSRDGAETVVERKTMDDVTTFCIKPQGKGFHFLKIFASWEGASKHTQVALYYVDA